MYKMLKFRPFAVVSLFGFMLFCLNEVNSMSTSNGTDATTSPSKECSNLKSCDMCVSNSSCLWCNSPEKCIVYPVSHVLPTSKDCALSAARWGVCWLNFEALIISMSVIGGALLIAISLCVCKCCGCCCFRKNEAKYHAEEMRLERERQDRSMRQDQRKQERQRRNDDIRRKYGLLRNDYQRLDED